ncbi:MAG: DUF5665 domain-containing protein [Candidatus Berkelbacteria bacterium]|nr:DUF5665 domain-containing protein [Candidatus Berkelbacteria bacterium]
MSKKDFVTDKKAPRSAYESMQEIADALERVRFYEYIDQAQHPWRIIWKSFVAGIARGFGFIIGATILIYILAYLFSKLGGLPAVGEFFRSIGDILMKSPKGMQ